VRPIATVDRVSLAREYVIDLRDDQVIDLRTDLRAVPSPPDEPADQLADRLDRLDRPGGPDPMARTRVQFAELRALSRDHARYFGGRHPGITGHQNGADAVGTLYL